MNETVAELLLGAADGGLVLIQEVCAEHDVTEDDLEDLLDLLACRRVSVDRFDAETEDFLDRVDVVVRGAVN